jgi:hypothetical protein
MLGSYLRNVWQENPSGLLFPNRNGLPRKRQHVMKFGLVPQKKSRRRALTVMGILFTVGSADYRE